MHLRKNSWCRHLYLHFFTLHVCIQIQHDSNIYHQERSFLGTRFHAWFQPYLEAFVKSAELKKLSNPPNLWQVSLIHQFLEFVISFSWKMQQRVQLKWIPDNNWWLIPRTWVHSKQFLHAKNLFMIFGKTSPNWRLWLGGFPNPQNHLEMHEVVNFHVSGLMCCKIHDKHMALMWRMSSW